MELGLNWEFSLTIHTSCLRTRFIRCAPPEHHRPQHYTITRWTKLRQRWLLISLIFRSEDSAWWLWWGGLSDPQPCRWLAASCCWDHCRKTCCQLHFPHLNFQTVAAMFHAAERVVAVIPLIFPTGYSYGWIHRLLYLRVRSRLNWAFPNGGGGKLFESYYSLAHSLM